MLPGTQARLSGSYETLYSTKETHLCSKEAFPGTQGIGAWQPANAPWCLQHKKGQSQKDWQRLAVTQSSLFYLVYIYNYVPLYLTCEVAALKIIRKGIVLGNILLTGIHHVPTT